MIISRTPFRISFFGGGTDYPAWFKENGGSVLSTSINKYCHIFCRYLPPFFNNKHRIVWSRVENVSYIEEIQHPSVRECMRFMDIQEGLVIHHDGDLPARSGLGSSSAFTVGLLNALHTLRQQTIDRQQLAIEAIRIEHDVIRENVGYQDQVAVAVGGFNRIDFQRNGVFTVEKINVSAERLGVLHDHLVLVFTGISRTASDIAGNKIKAISERKVELAAMQSMVDEAIKILARKDQIEEFGKLLHESWLLKRSLTPQVSNLHIDAVYERARLAGAIGGKLLGAGGGGFMLLFADPGRHLEIKKALGEFICVPFQFETLGSHILFDGKPKI